MPDKYEFRRFADNINHPWFNDIEIDLQRIWMSPNRFLLCILCVILMNIDETSFFQTKDWQHHNNQSNDHSQDPIPSHLKHKMVLFYIMRMD